MEFKQSIINKMVVAVKCHGYLRRSLRGLSIEKRGAYIDHVIDDLELIAGNCMELTKKGDALFRSIDFDKFYTD